MLGADRIAAVVADLAALSDQTDAGRIELLTALEQLKSAAAAAQTRLTDDFARSQRKKLIKAGSNSRDASRSITAQVGLARKDCPHKGSRHFGLAATLVHEMPRVLTALERGDTSEWRCTVIARETAHLSPEDRAEIDAAIADQLHAWGDARTEREARAWAQRLDPTERRTVPARPRPTGGCPFAPRRTA